MSAGVGTSLGRPAGGEPFIIAIAIFATFVDAPGWSSECRAAFAHQPVGCHIATRADALVGFACWDATARGFFGPMGTLESERGRGIGSALLLECLHAMAAHGYGYAIIGAVGPREFYQRVVEVVDIPGSAPGVYRGLLREGR